MRFLKRTSIPPPRPQRFSAVLLALFIFTAGLAGGAITATGFILHRSRSVRQNPPQLPERGMSVTPMALPFDLHGKAAALIFVAVDCPISNGYAPEINRIINEFAPKDIEFYLVYTDPAVSSQQIHQHAAAFGYHCPLLMDANHALTSRFNVTVTPEAAVINPAGQLLYRGRIDDLYVDFGKKRFAATKHDLHNALQAVVDNRPVPAELTDAIGCAI